MFAPVTSFGDAGVLMRTRVFILCPSCMQKTSLDWLQMGGLTGFWHAILVKTSKNFRSPTTGALRDGGALKGMAGISRKSSHWCVKRYLQAYFSI